MNIKKVESEELATLKQNLEQFEAQRMQLSGACGCHQHSIDEERLVSIDIKINDTKAKIESYGK